MKKIGDLMKELHLSKDDFAVLYFEVTQKKLSPTPFLSDSVAEKIVSHHQNVQTSPGKKSEKKSLKEVAVDTTQKKSSGGFFADILKIDTDTVEKTDIAHDTSSKKKTYDVLVNNSLKSDEKTDDVVLSVSDSSTSVSHDIDLNDLTKVAESRGLNAKIVSRNDASRSDARNVSRGQGNQPRTRSGSNVTIGQGSQRTRDSNGRNSPRNIGRTVSRVHHEIPKSIKEQKEAQVSTTLTKKTEIIVGEKITVKELSEKMGVVLPALIKVMMQNRIMGGINTLLDFETASLIGSEFNVDVKPEAKTMGIADMMDINLQNIADSDKNAAELQPRAPIVTIMGHVDHGKTSLLDYIRKTSFAGDEAGGITQSIGASSIDYEGKKITFIDTPGHELFTSLRSRGAKLTNIVVIVVAADDGLMPQTIESINHAKESGVSIIVAITKIDKQYPDLEKFKADLGAQGLVPEDRGGDVPIIPLSSKTGQGVDTLLETILLHAEMLDLRFDPNRNAVGVIIDVKKDARKGVIASTIILTGTLRVGDIVVAHNTYGKVKNLTDAKGKSVRSVHGGEPVMIMGFSDIPEPGRMIEVVDKEKDAQQKVLLVKTLADESNTVSTAQRFLDMTQQGEGVVLKLIIKSESPSSLEAVQGAIHGIVVPPNMRVKIIHAGIGSFSDSDVALAQAGDAIMIGFNATIPNSIKKSAQYHHVTIKSFEIIYELIDYIDNLLQGMIVKEAYDEHVGQLQVLAVFFKKEKMMVIGGKVTEGVARNGALFRVMRNGEEFARGEITSLQRDQTSVNEVGLGYECGMKIKSGKRIEEGDLLDLFVVEYR